MMMLSHISEIGICPYGFNYDAGVCDNHIMGGSHQAFYNFKCMLLPKDRTCARKAPCDDRYTTETSACSEPFPNLPSIKRSNDHYTTEICMAKDVRRWPILSQMWKIDVGRWPILS
jgi:hypothetical protein